MQNINLLLKMKINEITTLLEEIALLAYVENFDNVGLLVRNTNETTTVILVFHDVLEFIN